jgi:hypothetical protein
MDRPEVTRVVNDVISLLTEHYLDPEAAAAIARGPGLPGLRCISGTSGCSSPG